MNTTPQDIKTAVQVIKSAILQSQMRAVKAINQEQLALYYGIGRYVSMNSRKGFWGERCHQKHKRDVETRTARTQRFLRSKP